MNILHHHLKSVETSGLWDLYITHKSLSQILKNNTIRSSEEGKNILNEVSLVVVESLPVFNVLSQIDFFCCPKTGHLVFVHFPDVIVFDWKNDESVGIFLKKGFWKWALSLGAVSILRLSHHVGSLRLGTKVTWHLRLDCKLRRKGLRIRNLLLSIILTLLRVMRKNFCDFLLIFHLGWDLWALKKYSNYY